MAISDLKVLMPPPPEAPRIDAGAWMEVERPLGTSLPSDYKDFIGTYGFGQVGGFLCILSPFSTNPNVNLLAQIDRQLSALRELRGGGEESPYPLFPEQGGLMPLAITDNGDVLYWETCGLSDGWRIVVNDSRSPIYEAHNANMTTFLVSLFSDDFRSAILPRGITPEFVPLIE